MSRRKRRAPSRRVRTGRVTLPPVTSGADDPPATADWPTTCRCPHCGDRGVTFQLQPGDDVQDYDVQDYVAWWTRHVEGRDA